MKWTPEERLKLIKAITAKSYKQPVGETYQDLMLRIMFLCDMPKKFLENNKHHFEDAIKIAQREDTIIL